MLLKDIDGDDNTSVIGPVPPRDSAQCRQDTCCIWKYVAEEMRAAMTQQDGQCNDLARGCIRLGFHDAMDFSKTNNTNAGADGSIVLAGECETVADNNGLKNTCNQMRVWFAKYQPYGVGMADLIQMAANVGTVVCPLGPRVRTFVGRKDSTVRAPDGNLPLFTDSNDHILALMDDKTISPFGLIALLGAHSTAHARDVKPEIPGDHRLDSTPGVWDVAFYGEVLDNSSTSANVFKLDSDVNLSRDQRTSDSWRFFVGQQPGQFRWDKAYAAEYVRVSMLGVNNMNNLTECTGVLPPFIPNFKGITTPGSLPSSLLSSNRKSSPLHRKANSNQRARTRTQLPSDDQPSNARPELTAPTVTKRAIIIDPPVPETVHFLISPITHTPTTEADENPVRGPCPGLNALANHGYLPRNGRGVNLLSITTQGLAGIGLSPEIGLIVGALGYVSKLADLTRLLSLQFDLDELAGHLVTLAIEHDCSFSREDYAVGDNNAFNPKLWQVVMDEIGGSDMVTSFALGKAKSKRIDEEFTRHKTWYDPRAVAFGAIEVGLILTTLAPIGLGFLIGQVPLAWVRSLFEEERLPCDWAPFILKTNTITVLILGVEALLADNKLPAHVVQGIVLTPQGILDALVHHRNGTRPDDDMRREHVALMRSAVIDMGLNTTGVDEIAKLWGNSNG
ncbi:peroxidase [Ophiocordyceps camponoti-floridani]|uniref:Peroxidase n=1 Tax=Ophiocordyceps camponoti-floridani TaxID=2030778 RepID=A0A8H4Q2D4_9HYPO|nr:peroxidase [Ophiocordyceps camponoti-floridani]